MLLYTNQIMPALFLQLRQRVPALEVAVSGQDNGRVNIGSFYHFYKQLVLIGDRLSFDDRVNIGVVHQVIKRADFGNIERLLPTATGEIALRIRWIGGNLNVGAVHGEQTMTSVKPAAASNGGKSTKDMLHCLR